MSRIPGIQLMNMQGPGGEYRSSSLPFRWCLCLMYIAGLTFLSLMPSDSLEKLPLIMPHEDKVAHFLIYAGLVMILCWAMRLFGTGSVKKLFTIALLCSLYGLIMEFMQEIVQPGDRVLSLFDALANFGGALMASLVLIRWTKNRSISQVYLR